jgi:DegV family protein with EDD domain
MAVRIVTDSSCDLPADEVAALGIEVVPLTIRFGSAEYTDGVDLSVEDFYAEMAATDGLPETAAPSPGSFEVAYRAQAEAGADAVVCINISAELSATMQSAQNAARAVEADLPVRVVDSRSITLGLGNQVLEAARMAADGADTDAIVARIEALRARTKVYGVLDTLDNLKKGGRIGGAQALLGSVLSIKPCVDISTGRVEESSKQRTRKKSLQWLRDRVLEHGTPEHLALMHAAAADIDDAVDLVTPSVPRDQIRVGLIGPVIGTHAGRGTVGACFLVPE